MANNLNAWEFEVKLKLDMKELRREWNDFLKDISKDFQKEYEDLRIEVWIMFDNAKTYLGSDGTISTIVSAIHDVTQEIDKMRMGAVQICLKVFLKHKKT